MSSKEKLLSAKPEAPPQPRKSFLSVWVEERVDLGPLRQFIQHKMVPMHRHSYWYYLGGMVLFLFIIQAFTGILLLLYYQPSESNAFESVRFIMTQVRFGWLIRSVHAWGANLLIALAFGHMFSTFFMKAYRKPREMTWMSGVLLLFLMLGFGFSGYLLPWNTLSYFATAVGTNIVGVLPFIGEFSLRFLRGGDSVSGATLTRFFGFHVAILPAVTGLLLVLHLWLVQKQGMSVPPSIEIECQQRGTKPRAIPFSPDFMLRDLMAWYLVLGVLSWIATLYPWELGVKADPFASAPPGIKPEWYFLFMFQTLKYIPAKVLAFDGEVLGILAFGLGGLLWLLVPFLDRNPSSGRMSRIITKAGIWIVIYILVMTVVAYVAK
ncbi:MAG: cytochrome bc complex cytochrome b subunit [Acidobacteria bacterium]|nr:cytochrome bc complex cytochrome b subunit [Acidobacteriota bacterium]